MLVKYIKMLCFLHENHHFDFLFYIICELQKTKVISLLSFILVSFILTDEGNKSFILYPSSLYLQQRKFRGCSCIFQKKAVPLQTELH